MSSSVVPLTTIPPSSLQTLSLTSTSAYLKEIETNVRDFWSTFPCPPPWKPRLLIEVNASRLDPDVSRTVQSFLAGKCDIRHVLSGSDDDYNLEPSDLRPRLDFRPTDTSDTGSSLGGAATSHHQWCDTTCQLSLGCAILLVVVVLMVAAIICITRHRVTHKMAATRPSRQQLQLSTSTSDAVNCTEFSNLEVGALARAVGVNVSVTKLNPQIQGDDDFIYPPFRHRGLPHLPPACHPSCDPKWNCPNCSSCHPLMRMSPPDLYYSQAYSAVYETVDDEDEYGPQESDFDNHPRGITPVLSESRDITLGCVPCQASPSSISTVQLRPYTNDDLSNNKHIAETGFNGEDNQNTPSRSTLPKYFELEQNCAFSGHADSSTHNHDFMNTFGVSNTSTECYNPTFTGPVNTFHVPLAYQQGMLIHLPSHSCAFSATPSTHNFSTFRSSAETSVGTNNGETNSAHLHTSANQCHIYGYRHTDHNRYDRGSISYSGDRWRQNIQHEQAGLGGGDVSQSSYNPHVCSTSSMFRRDATDNYFCPTCHQDNTTHCVNQQPTQLSSDHLQQNSPFQVVPVAPDLLKEASSHSRMKEHELISSNDASDGTTEVPLRKPVLALHSQYFAKTPVA